MCVYAYICIYVRVDIQEIYLECVTVLNLADQCDCYSNSHMV